MDVEKVITIQNEAQAMFRLLQQIQAPMNENNIAILNACLSSLKLITKICYEATKEETENAGEVDAE